MTKHAKRILHLLQYLLEMYAMPSTKLNIYIQKVLLKITYCNICIKEIKTLRFA